MSESTVEDCLRALREMFPAQRVYIDRTDYAAAEPKKDAFIQCKVKLTVAGKRTRHGIAAPEIFTAPTLSEAMAQVRSWKQEQEK